MKSIENSTLEKGISILLKELKKRNISVLVKKDVTFYEQKRDAIIEINKLNRKFIVEVKSQFYPQQIEKIAFAYGFENEENSNYNPLLITQRITESSFDICKENGMCVIDLTGNILLNLPGLYIERYRHTKHERKRGTSGTVFTAKASRLVRALLAYPNKEWTHSELVEKTKVSAGYASTQIDKMKKEQYISKLQNTIKLIDPEKMLNDWRSAYRFDRYRGRNFYAMNTSNYDNGLKKMKKSLLGSGVEFAFTGWSGAYIRAPYSTSHLYMAYVDHFPVELESMFPVDNSGNVILYLPQDEGVFQFTTQSEYGPVVSDTQLYLDLSEMPGRAIDQADYLKEQTLHWEDINNA